MNTERRDYAFEALAEVTGTDWSAGRGELNKALASIREQSEIEDSFALSVEIHDRAKMYRAVMGEEILLTPSALAKHWKRVAEESSRPTSTRTNVHAPATECVTCSGDRFVLVATRPVVASQWMRERGLEIRGDAVHEEYAACPDCNAEANTSFPRFDGSYARALDPARVREMMRG